MTATVPCIHRSSDRIHRGSDRIRGTRIEILPKHVDDATAPDAARKVLRTMLLDCLDLD